MRNKCKAPCRVLEYYYCDDGDDDEVNFAEEKNRFRAEVSRLILHS